LMQIRNKVSETHDAIHRLRSVRRQVRDAVRRSRGNDAHEHISRSADALLEKLAPIEQELIEPRAAEDDDTLRFPARLNYKLVELMATVGSADAAPTAQSREVFDSLVHRVDAQLEKLAAIVDTDMQAFLSELTEAGVPAIVPDAEPVQKPATSIFAR